MNEALLLLLNLLVVTYLCWLIVKADKSKLDQSQSLGLFAYKDDSEQ